MNYTKTCTPNKIEAHRVQVQKAIVTMDRTEAEMDHNLEMVEKLRTELAQWEASLATVSREAEQAINAYWALETMTTVEFITNLSAAHTYARATGSVGCTYNNVTWER